MFSILLDGFQVDLRSRPFGEMMDQVKDWTDYYPPEMLPNGDIILRRRTPVDPEGGTPQDEPDNDALEGGAIDL